MVKTWKLVNRLVKNSRLKGLTSLDSFPTKNVVCTYLKPINCLVPIEEVLDLGRDCGQNKI